MEDKTERIGFTCAYTPLPLIRAAGYIPYRVLPLGESPDQAGQLLHDNICPHIKHVLNRAMSKDLPELSGMIFMNSCDAMRRLSDAWKIVRPEDNVFLIELPSVNNKAAISFLANEFSRLYQGITGEKISVSNDNIWKSISLYNTLADCLSNLREQVRSNGLKGGSATLQEIYNLASTAPAEDAIDASKNLLANTVSPDTDENKVPIYLFGNVIPDPETFRLFESCGVLLADDDLCTGSRAFHPIKINHDDDPFLTIAQSMYSRPPCARTIDTANPLSLAEKVLAGAKACDAKGVIGYTTKFCDPYLARLPTIREVLSDADIPLLLLEGDCTMGSIGQQQTRIEAFIEMLR